MDIVILIFSFAFNLFVLFGYEFDNVSRVKTIAAIVVLCLVLKLFEWLKIYDETSFYISLLQQTILDIMHFVLIYIVAISAVGLSTMFIIMLSNEK